MYQPQLGVVPTYYTFTMKVRVSTKTEKFSPGSAPLALAFSSLSSCPPPQRTLLKSKRLSFLTEE